MAIDFEAHWQVMYDGITTALTDGGNGSVPVLHVDSSETQTGGAQEPPYVLYTAETMVPVGTVGDGPSKVLRDGWKIVARARDLSDVLDYISNVVTKLELEDLPDTADGYRTTAIDILGFQTLYEQDAKLNAGHLRISWERSK